MSAACILVAVLIYVFPVSPTAALLIGKSVRLADTRDSRPLATVTDIADHRPVE